MRALGFRATLIAIALGALLLRVLYAYAIVRSRPLLGDALEFQESANLLAAGHGYIQPLAWYAHHVSAPTADKPPVYPFLEAAVSLFGGRSWGWHDLVGVLAGTGTVVTVGLLGRRIAGAAVGLLAAAIAAVYPLLIAADGSLRSESVFALLVTLALLLAARQRERCTVAGMALLGAVVALAALTRAEALLLLVLVVPLAAGELRHGVVALAACVLVLTPWLVRCWSAFGQPVLISTNVGGLLAGANCPESYGGALLGQWWLGCLSPARSGNEAQASDHLRDIGLRYAGHHVSRLPVVLAARVGRSFELFRPAQGWGIESFFEGRDLTVEKAGVLLYYPLALLAVLGALILRRRRGPVWLLGAPFVLVLTTSLTAYGITRFRVVAEPALVVLAAIGIHALATRLRAGAVLRPGWR